MYQFDHTSPNARATHLTVTDQKDLKPQREGQSFFTNNIASNKDSGSHQANLGFLGSLSPDGPNYLEEEESEHFEDDFDFNALENNYETYDVS